MDAHSEGALREVFVAIDHRLRRAQETHDRDTKQARRDEMAIPMIIRVIQHASPAAVVNVDFDVDLALTISIRRGSVNLWSRRVQDVFRDIRVASWCISAAICVLNEVPTTGEADAAIAVAAVRILKNMNEVDRALHARPSMLAFAASGVRLSDEIIRLILVEFVGPHIV